MTTFIDALNSLTTADLENWKAVKDALATRKIELEKEKKEEEKAKRHSLSKKDKQLRKVLGDYVKSTKATTKKMYKATGKQLFANFKSSLPCKGEDRFSLLTQMSKMIHKNHLKPEAKILDPPGAKNKYFQNFSKYWGTTVPMPLSKEELKLAGGKRAWNREKWNELTVAEQRNPESPWNK